MRVPSLPHFSSVHPSYLVSALTFVYAFVDPGQRQRALQEKGMDGSARVLRQSGSFQKFFVGVVSWAEEFKNMSLGPKFFQFDAED